MNYIISIKISCINMQNNEIHSVVPTVVNQNITPTKVVERVVPDAPKRKRELIYILNENNIPIKKLNFKI